MGGCIHRLPFRIEEGLNIFRSSLASRSSAPLLRWRAKTLSAPPTTSSRTYCKRPTGPSIPTSSSPSAAVPAPSPALQADYFLGNRSHNATLLPDTFHYAGVMSFSGLIYSTQGKVKYRVHAPAPTLFCHGTVDQLVPYNKIQIFNQGTFGSHALIKRFEKYDYPYHIRRYEGMGHEVAGYYKYEFKMMDEFIEDYIFGKKKLQIDELYYNPNLKRHPHGSFKIRDLKKL